MAGQTFMCARVLPASIDTPLFQHAANFTGRSVRPIRPVYAPEEVARAIVGLVDRPRREIVVGRAGRALAMLRAIAPGFTERLLARQVERQHFRDVPAPPTWGNLHQPLPDLARTTGGWRSTA